MSQIMKNQLTPIKLPLESFETLKKLAKEDACSWESLLQELIFNEDKKRHLQFQPGNGHVRVRCNSSKCVEAKNRS